MFEELENLTETVREKRVELEQCHVLQQCALLDSPEEPANPRPKPSQVQQRSGRFETEQGIHTGKKDEPKCAGLIATNFRCCTRR